MLAGRKKKVRLGLRRLWDVFHECNLVQLWALQMLNNVGSCQSCIQEGVSNMLIVVGIPPWFWNRTLVLPPASALQCWEFADWNLHGMHFLPLVCTLQMQSRGCLVGVFSWFWGLNLALRQSARGRFPAAAALCCNHRRGNVPWTGSVWCSALLRKGRKLNRNKQLLLILNKFI